MVFYYGSVNWQKQPHFRKLCSGSSPSVLLPRTQFSKTLQREPLLLVLGHTPDAQDSRHACHVDLCITTHIPFRTEVSPAIPNPVCIQPWALNAFWDYLHWGKKKSSLNVIPSSWSSPLQDWSTKEEEGPSSFPQLLEQFQSFPWDTQLRPHLRLHCNPHSCYANPASSPSFLPVVIPKSVPRKPYVCWSPSQSNS